MTRNFKYCSWYSKKEIPMASLSKPYETWFAIVQISWRITFCTIPAFFTAAVSVLRKLFAKTLRNMSNYVWQEPFPQVDQPNRQKKDVSCTQTHPTCFLVRRWSIIDHLGSALLHTVSNFMFAGWRMLKISSTSWIFCFCVALKHASVFGSRTATTSRPLPWNEWNMTERL